MTARSNRPAFRWVAAVGIVGTVALAAGAFSLSFTSLMHLALRSGIDPAQAWEWPLIVDGLIIVATVGVVARAGRPGTGFAWLLLAAGAATSIIGNALQAARLPTVEPTWIAVGVATIPPMVLLASTHMTVILTRPNRPTPELPDQSAVEGDLPPAARADALAEAPAPMLRGAQSPPLGSTIPPMLTALGPSVAPEEGLLGSPSMPSETPKSDVKAGDGASAGDWSRTWRAEKAVGLRDAGLSVTEIAQAMDVSTGSVRRYLKPSPPTDQMTGDLQ
ncbi:MAG: DUF2637 domain-containing protein [Propionibacteriaceae bacterium]|nr:DUF2637 domain-containing protein [Propionibacteriaceae bacterium]